MELYIGTLEQEFSGVPGVSLSLARPVWNLLHLKVSHVHSFHMDMGYSYALYYIYDVIYNL